MTNINCCIFQGNLTADPVIVKDDMARFTVAVNDGVGDKRTTTYIRCIAFGEQVKIIRQYLKKGKPVAVQGRMQTNSWTDKTGATRKELELRLHNYNGFYFIGKPEESEAIAEEHEDDSKPMQPSKNAGSRTTNKKETDLDSVF
jgi:single-strand DNA-binding protein